VRWRRGGGRRGRNRERDKVNAVLGDRREAYKEGRVGSLRRRAALGARPASEHFAGQLAMAWAAIGASAAAAAFSRSGSQSGNDLQRRSSGHGSRSSHSNSKVEIGDIPPPPREQGA
jgi:hypothetical protein